MNMEPTRRPLIPPHGNAEVHKRLMARLRKMTPKELFQTIVDAGIYKPNGELAEPYTGGPDLSPTAAE